MNRSLLISFVGHLLVVVAFYGLLNHYQTSFQRISRKDKKRIAEMKRMSRKEFAAKETLKKKLEEHIEKKFKNMDPRKMEELKAKIKPPEKIKTLAKLLAEREKMLRKENDPKKRAELRKKSDEELRKIFKSLEKEFEKAAEVAKEQIKRDALKRKFTRKAREVGLPRVKGGIANLMMSYKPKELLEQLFKKMSDYTRKSEDRLKHSAAGLVKSFAKKKEEKVGKDGKPAKDPLLIPIPGPIDPTAKDADAKRSKLAKGINKAVKDNAQTTADALRNREQKLQEAAGKLEDLKKKAGILKEAALANRGDKSKSAATEKLVADVLKSSKEVRAIYSKVHDSLKRTDRSLSRAKLDRSADAKMVKALTTPLRSAGVNTRTLKDQIRKGKGLNEVERAVKVFEGLKKESKKFHDRQAAVINSRYAAVKSKAALAGEIEALIKKADTLKPKDLRFALEYKGVLDLADATSVELRSAYREYQLNEKQGEVDSFRVQLLDSLMQALAPKSKGKDGKGEPDKSLNPVTTALKDELEQLGKKAARETADEVAGEMQDEEEQQRLAEAAENGEDGENGEQSDAEGDAAESEGPLGSSEGAEGDVAPGEAGEGDEAGEAGQSEGEATDGPASDGPPGEGDQPGEAGSGDLAQAMAGKKGEEEGPGGPASIGYTREGAGVSELLRAMDYFDEGEYSKIIAYTARYKPSPPPELKQVEATATIADLQEKLGRNSVRSFAALLYIDEKASKVASEQTAVQELAKREDVKFNSPKKVGKYFAAIPYFEKDPKLDGIGNDPQWKKKLTTSVWLPHNKGAAMLRMGWNARGLWGFMDVRDKSGKLEVADSRQFWNGDCIEFWFDMRNTKARSIRSKRSENSQQLWIWPLRGGEIWDTRSSGGVTKKKGYQRKRGRWAVSRMKKPYTGYHMEFLIARRFLTNLDRFRAGNVLGFHYVINHNWKDGLDDVFVDTRFGGHSDHPDMWGNLMLVGSEASLTLVDREGQAMAMPRVEIGSPIFVEVKDPDRNLDPGIEDRITVLASVQDGDWEGVELKEIGVNTGVFRGAVVSSFELTHTGDGALTLGSGDKLVISYLDQFRVMNQKDKKYEITIPVATPIYQLNFKNESQGLRRVKHP